MRILENLMLDLMKVSFLDMLLPRKHTYATILDYIRFLRVQMSRIKHQETILDSEYEDDDQSVGTQAEELEENKEEREEDDMDTSEDEEYIQEEEIR